MATAPTWTIIAENPPYYTVRVKFNGCDFEQTIICEKTGAAFMAAVDAYAAEYATAWHQLPDEGTSDEARPEA